MRKHSQRSSTQPALFTWLGAPLSIVMRARRVHQRFCFSWMEEKFGWPNFEVL